MGRQEAAAALSKAAHNPVPCPLPSACRLPLPPLPPLLCRHPRCPPTHLPLQALEAELGRTQIQLDENEEHTRVLAEHLGSVRLEIQHTQGRLTARQREVQGEAHLQELAARESGRLRSDAARLRARREELAHRVTGIQGEVLQAGERMDQFRLVMNWNQVGEGLGDGCSRGPVVCGLWLVGR